MLQLLVKFFLEQEL